MDNRHSRPPPCLKNLGQAASVTVPGMGWGGDGGSVAGGQIYLEKERWSREVLADLHLTRMTLLTSRTSNEREEIKMRMER